MAQKPPAGAVLNKQMAAPMNAALVAINAQNWPEAKAKLDVADAAARRPRKNSRSRSFAIPSPTAPRSVPGKVAAIKAALATGVLSSEEAKPYKGTLAAALDEAGDKAGSSAAFKAYIDEYGGNAAQYGGLATEARNAKDFPTAEAYIQKAIDAAKAANMAPAEVEKYQAFQAHTFWDAKDDAKYTAAMGALIAANPGKEDYWKELMARATLPRQRPSTQCRCRSASGPRSAVG